MTQASTIDLVRTAVSAGDGGVLRIGRPMRADTLSVFPLYRAAPPSSYVLYTDVGATGAVLVTEVDEAGSVPDLSVTNQLAAPVLLVESWDERRREDRNRPASGVVMLSTLGSCHAAATGSCRGAPASLAASQ